MPALAPFSQAFSNINASTGQSTAALMGDRSIALTAQVNRFLKAQGYPEQPLVPGVVTIAVGLSALGILQARLTQSLIQSPSAEDRTAISTQMSAISHAQSDPVAYIMPRIEEITRTLAIWGDLQGYKPAVAGITQRDPRIKLAVVKWVGLGLVAVLGAFAGYRVYTRGRLA